MLGQNVVRHRVGVAHNQSRNDEQDRPQQNIEALPKPRQRRRLPVRKIGEQRLKARLRAVDKAEVIFGIPHAHDAAEDEVRRRQHERDHDEIDRTADEQSAPLRAQTVACGVNRLSAVAKRRRHARGHIVIEFDLRTAAPCAVEQHRHKADQNGDGPLAAQRLARRLPKIRRKLHKFSSPPSAGEGLSQIFLLLLI